MILILVFYNTHSHFHMEKSDMLIKQESITFQKRGSYDFWQMLTLFFLKGKYAIPSLVNDMEVLKPLHLINQNCLLKTFLGTIILMTKIIPYLFSL